MDIMRNRNETEKDLKVSGFRDIRYWRSDDILQRSLAKITEVSHDYLYVKRLPFCHKCAHTAVLSKMDDVEKQIKKISQQRHPSHDTKINFDVDYGEFGKRERFEYVGEKIIKENKLVDGLKLEAETGKYKNYVCKICGAAIHLQFGNKELRKNDDPKGLFNTKDHGKSQNKENPPLEDPNRK